MSSRKLKAASSNEPFRKKYGKNLHKLHSLTSAPPPPISSLSFSTNSSSKKHGTNSNGSTSGGLLLLSTKKGISDRKNDQSQLLTAERQKGQSTHDALLSVLNGEKEGKKEFVPVAWGMKAQTQASSSQSAAATARQVNAKSQSHPIVNVQKRDVVPVEVPAPFAKNQTIVKKEQYDNKNIVPLQNIDQGSRDENTTQNQPPPSKSTRVEAKISNRSPNRSTSPPSAIASASPSASVSAPISSQQLQTQQQQQPQPQHPKEDQVEFMKKLAKERAEKRRLEEERRVLEQKERAAQRLKELELKMRAAGKKHKEQTSASGTVAMAAAEKQPRKQSLYDPSRTFSSLLGGGTKTSADASSDVSRNGSAKLVGADDRNDPSTPSIIHLNSYDDRDRGSHTNAGPRLLFDPKSGSMVAAPGAKEKKSAKKKSNRGNGGSSDGTPRRNGIGHGRKLDDEFQEDEDVGVSRRNSRQRQRDAARRAKRKEEKGDGSNVKIRRSSGASNRTEGKASKKGRNLPRTCGVLYKRNTKGEFVSADGCEGDQGYGAHSVPGGRIRNPKGYAAQKQKGRLSGKQAGTSGGAATTPGNGGVSMDGYNNAWHSHQLHNLASSSMDYDYTRALNRSDFMPKNQQQPVEDTDVNKGVELPSSVNVVSGDEKLDLLAGLDASPKLQATAAAWAPSEAVLALAAANAKKVDNAALPVSDYDSNSNGDMSDSGVDAFNAMGLIDPESEDVISAQNDMQSPSIGLGLGFDPSKNMDSLMMSPVVGGHHSEGLTDMPSFDLKDAAALPTQQSNPFISANVLLSSSTWGTSHNPKASTLGSLSNWDIIGNNGNDNKVQKNESSSSAFLSLGVGGGHATWGGGNGDVFTGFNSIDGPSMGGSD